MQPEADLEEGNAYTEIEIKLLTPNLDGLAERLERVGARRLRARTYEYNVRYDDGSGRLTAQGIVLRLRRDDRITLTYKERARKPVPGFATRREIETEVADFEAMDAILRGLGYRPSVVYEKYRTIYRMGDAEIALDETPMGNFTEVEGPPEAVEQTVRTLELDDAPRFTSSYLELFARAKAALGLNFDDLTFENFAGIPVPPEVFSGGER